MRLFFLLCLVVAACDGRSALRNSAPKANAGDASDSVPPLPDGAPAGADPVATAVVVKDVASLNAASPREGADFVADGWSLVSVTDAPNAQVMGLDPSLITAAPEQLRVQMASTSPREADTDNLVAIVTQAQTPELREAAIAALARVPGERGQNALLGLVTVSALQSDSDARHDVAARLRPRDLDADNAGAMGALLDSPLLDETDKGQMAFTLALIGVRDGTSLPPSVLQGLSAAVQARLSAARALIVGGAQ